MNLIEEHNKKWEFFRDISLVATRVYNKYRPGLMESAYEAALKYLLEKDGYKVQRQVLLPIYWDNIKLDQYYRMDLVLNENIILELKALNAVITEHRKQLWNYMNLTHLPYGMIINFGPTRLYSEWYFRDEKENSIKKIQLM